MKDYYPVSMPRYSRYAQRLKASRTVRFPNDIVFQDHIRQGDLEQVGRFIRARKVTLDTIYPSGECCRGWQSWNLGGRTAQPCCEEDQSELCGQSWDVGHLRQGDRLESTNFSP